MFLIVFDLCIYTFDMHERLRISIVIFGTLGEDRRLILLGLYHFDIRRLRLWWMIGNNRNRWLLDQILRANLRKG
jgi:hypothetical protein